MSKSQAYGGAEPTRLSTQLALSTRPRMLLQFINGPGAGGLHISGQNAVSFVIASVEGMATEGGQGGTALGAPGGWSLAEVTTVPKYSAISPGTGLGPGLCLWPRCPGSRRTAEVVAGGGGMDRWIPGQDPGQAVLTFLLCFSPGSWHLQSGQSVPGTHNQHPVGADAHQSVHTLGH